MEADLFLCAKCGAEMGLDDAFCGQCGSQAGAAEVEGTPEAAGSQSGNQCAACGATLTDEGPYCPECGAEGAMGTIAVTAIPEEEVKAFCPNCAQPTPMRGTYRFCPRDGQPIHILLEVNELSLYMRGVQTQTEFRVVSLAREDVTLRAFQVKLIDQDLRVGLFDLRMPHPVNPDCPPLQLDRLVHPRKPNADLGIAGCPEGDCTLAVVLEYECNGHRYSLTGRHPITVLPHDADPLTINNYVGHRIKQEGDGIKSSTPYLSAELNFNGVEGESRAARFIKQVKEERGLNFRPVRMHIDSVVELKQTLSVPAPDWEPTDRVSISFEDNCTLYNYGIVSGCDPRQQDFRPIIFGRQRGAVDIRLVEIERILRARNKGTDSADASHSTISRRQWEFTLSQDRYKGGGIGVRALSENNMSVVPGQGGNKRVETSEPTLIGRNEWVDLYPFGKRNPRIGLCYAANAPYWNAIDTMREKARDILALRDRAPAKLPDWHGPFGAYRLDRRHSLSDDLRPSLEDLCAREAYVLCPGWMTLGSADDACIPIPKEGVAPIHAYLFPVDGHFFICPAGEDTDVHVDGEQVPADQPWPVNHSGAEIQLAGVTIQFGPIQQMFIET